MSSRYHLSDDICPWGVVLYAKRYPVLVSLAMLLVEAASSSHVHLVTVLIALRSYQESDGSMCSRLLIFLGGEQKMRCSVLLEPSVERGYRGRSVCNEVAVDGSVYCAQHHPMLTNRSRSRFLDAMVHANHDELTEKWEKTATLTTVSAMTMSSNHGAEYITDIFDNLRPEGKDARKRKNNTQCGKRVPAGMAVCQLHAPNVTFRGSTIPPLYTFLAGFAHPLSCIKTEADTEAAAWDVLESCVVTFSLQHVPDQHVLEIGMSMAGVLRIVRALKGVPLYRCARLTGNGLDVFDYDSALVNREARQVSLTGRCAYFAKPFHDRAAGQKKRERPVSEVFNVETGTNVTGTHKFQRTSFSSSSFDMLDPPAFPVVYDDDNIL